VAKLDLSLSDDELEEYLRDQRTCRVATVGPGGDPHVVPLWFVWHGGALYLNSTLGNPTVENLLRNGRASAVVDDGERYDELRGAVISGAAERADGDSTLEEVDRLWSDKYLGGNPTPYRRWKDRVWLRLLPDQVASWDFRKIPEAKAGRAEEGT
jgi:nitroimidazol reductase NimA-like FMN-containing flavoprotein (pyridoxamine 5'-phosphate oxidase superfamily)